MSGRLGFGSKKNSGGKQWVHPSETLLNGQMVYQVKFLGNVEVDQPKGTEVVKDAIRKIKFNKPLKKAEGVKPPKVEIAVSINGLVIQDVKHKIVQHQFPLHRISYCADDKSDKKMFTFIAKEADTNKHHCFVFDSEKCAEEITLTIGQAFDLAYKKFLETSGKDMDMKKQYLLLQKKVQQLTQENLELKARVADLERLVEPSALSELDQGSVGKSEPAVGRKLEGLVYQEQNGSSHNGDSSVPTLAPPPPVPNRTRVPATPTQNSEQSNQGEVDLFGAVPFTASPSSAPSNAGVATPPSDPFSTPTSAKSGGAGDPFGMGSFTPASQQDLDSQIQQMDRELLDLRVT